jgi:amidase
MTDDPAWASIATLQDQLHAGSVSAIALLEAQIDRIERIDPALHAIATLDVDGARRAAAAADRMRSRGTPLGPLHGIALTLKDSHAVAGVRSTIGVADTGDHVPTVDGAVAARLRAAGAIILGKTNLSSWLYDIQTVSDLFGRTNNPWDLGRTPGGSSGGSAAVVAAGLAVADVGSDIGGSIRIPASFCGVVGFKPTEGRIPETGHMWTGRPRSFWYMESISPIARTVADVAAMFEVLAGPDGRDWTVPPVPHRPAMERRVSDLRIAVCEALPGEWVEQSIRDTVRRVADALADAGAVVEWALPDVDWAAGLALRDRLFRFGDAGFSARATASGHALADYFDALDERSRFIATWEAFLDDWDVLLTPATNRTAFEHRAMGEAFDIGGETIDYWIAERHAQPANLIGSPAISIPAGLDEHGLPIGIQLIGARWSDERVLSVARAIEEVLGVPARPPGFA